MKKVNLADQIAAVDRPWDPRVLAELNGQQLRLARFEGDFVWHAHDAEDEMFLVLEGRVEIELRGETVELGPGELCVVPRGVEHRPRSEEGAAVLLFEPAATRNTGSTDHDLSIEPEELRRV